MTDPWDYNAPCNGEAFTRGCFTLQREKGKRPRPSALTFVFSSETVYAVSAACWAALHMEHK